MNDIVLKSLTAILAIGNRLTGSGISRRGLVEVLLRPYLTEEKIADYLDDFDRYQPSVVDSTATFDVALVQSLCNKINQELEARQKFIVYLRIAEFISANSNSLDQSCVEFLKLIADIFRIAPEEAQAIREISVSSTQKVHINGSSVLLVHGHQDAAESHVTSIELHDFSGILWVINLQRAGIMMARYTGSDRLNLNGIVFEQHVVQVLSQGAVIRNQRSAAIYFSTLLNHFLEPGRTTRMDFEARNVVYRFKNKKIGIHDLSTICATGEMVAIMGGSGAGKSTLLSILNGTYLPSEGSVLINGVDIASDPAFARGLIGNIPQDDLLIEELSVFDNLFYNTKLCFGELDDWQLTGKVNEMLKAIGLWEARDLRVGDVLNKSISGGQRKRLNIALELIREPAILFVDEPTSGLSSKDAENVMDLLKQLALSGKLVFVVIHQPSSDIFKLFDRLIMLDKGGFLVYDGNPLEAVNYFKQEAGMLDTREGICERCGNVNPDQIFNILEQESIDEFGNRKQERKVTPEEWYNKRQQHPFKSVSATAKSRTSTPPIRKIATFKKQLGVFFRRDLFAKLSNRQYMLINLLEAPLLAAGLASLLRFSIPEKDYSLYENDNIPAYLFICVVVSLFLGLSVSGEEILKDRKIRKRESFLNLSRTAYLYSKIILLFSLSAIQMAGFVIVGNTILGIHGMYGSYFLALFASACFSNMLGLNISSVMKSSVAVYILIPILIIPQILLSGVIVRFNKLNSWSGSADEIPLAGNLMVSRWTYEALAVHQFKNNEHQEVFYPYDRQMSRATYIKDYWDREMQKASGRCTRLLHEKGSEKELEKNWSLIQYELTEGSVALSNGYDKNFFKNRPLNESTLKEVDAVLEKIRIAAVDEFNESSARKEALLQRLSASPSGADSLNNSLMSHENQSLIDLLTNKKERSKIYEDGHRLVQLFEPIYRPAEPKVSFFQQPFFMSEKNLFGNAIDTFRANVLVIWGMTLLLYLVLQFDLLNKFFKR